MYKYLVVYQHKISELVANTIIDIEEPVYDESQVQSICNSLGIIYNLVCLAYREKDSDDWTPIIQPPISTTVSPFTPNFAQFGGTKDVNQG